MKNLSWLTPFVLREKRGLSAWIALALVVIAMEALLPWPLKLIIDHVLTDAPLPAGASWIQHMPAADSKEGLLAWLSAGVLLLFVGSRLLAVATGVLKVSVCSRLQYSLAGEVFGHLQSLALTYHRRSRKGDLMHRVMADTNCLPTLISGVLLLGLTSAVSLVVFFSIMFQLDATLALISLVVTIPMLILTRVLAPKMAERAYEQQQLEGQIWSTAEQSLSAVPLVQGFGREEHESRRFEAMAGQTMRAYIKTLATQLQFKIGIGASEAAGVALIMLIGGMYVQSGTLTLGALVVFLSYLASLYSPLDALAFLPSTVAEAGASAKRVMQVLGEQEQVKEMPGAQAVRFPGGCAAGRVTFERVVFGYDLGNPVLSDISLDIPAGQTVALVGATGAGKSTLVSLIPRLIDPWQGSVLLDGHDVRRMPLSQVRAQVAVVLQDSLLLPVSVAQNIAYGRRDASMPDIIAAAKAARAHDFIRKLPRGYETVLGERGATLSGGERQRLCIARALLRQAPILILDEPTSALDVETEMLLLESLGSAAETKTKFIIAHRLSTVERADLVVVLEGGRVVESGTPQTLRRAGGPYARLCRAHLIGGAEVPAPSATLVS